MYVILLFTVLLVALSIYCITFVLSYRSMITDIRSRAQGVMNYIREAIEIDDLVHMRQSGVQATLDSIEGVGGLSRLYFAVIEEDGEIVTSLPDGYIPTGNLAADLHLSLTTKEAVQGKGIYQTGMGRVYGIFWPVINQKQELLGAVCMEFDADLAYQSFRQAAQYGLGLSVALIALFSILAYLSMTKAAEPFYKKLAYTDLMTGCDNRMAFEHRMRECNEICDRGGSVTLMVFDVNNLKTVNDTLGHDFGDQYLINTAHTLQEHLGKKQALYRIGGDEFAALLVNASEENAQNVCGAVRNETRKMIKGQPFSCAYGFAAFTPGIDNSMRDVFGRADRAMYDEKKRQKAEKHQVTRGAYVEASTNG
jgi:diguanylate cyclase (GGDEF)-like protein